MQLIVTSTAILYLLANLPLLYGLAFVHGRHGVGLLWGYSPHQFLYLVLIFPFGALATLTAFYVLVTKIGPTLPPDYGLRWFYDHWAIVLVLGLMPISIITTLDYLYTTNSLDKLQPIWVRKSVDSIQSLDQRLKALRRDERPDMLEAMIQDSLREKEDSIRTLPSGSDRREELLLKMKPEVFLQVSQDIRLQRKIPLIASRIQSLDLIETLAVLLVAYIAIVSAGLILHALHELGASRPNDLFLRNATNAIFYATVLFGLFPIFFIQYRGEIERFTGPGLTILPHIFVGAFVIIVLVLLAALDPGRKGTIDAVLVRYALPALLIGTGIGAELRGPPELLRQLLGPRTTFGIQAMLFLAGSVIMSAAIYQIWPRR